jgi:NAD(P)-dependent dehydrogenase (short-subunit alcohol dehydrogenase family)
MKLEHRVALVTGSRRGIGRAIVLAMAREGASVCISDVNQEDCDTVAAEVEALGRHALAVKCDVTSKVEVKAMVEAAVAKFGKVDILVNNAARATLMPFLRLTEAEWDATMDATLKSQFLCSQAVAKYMIRNGWGRIVNLASISSGGMGLATPGMAHYTAAKGGVVALTKAMAAELTPLGINVNAILPGAINSDAMKSFTTDIKDHRFLAKSLMGRMGRPEEIAALAVFLASDDASFMSGSSVVIDGGWLAT